MPSKSSPVWLITATSSGFGKAIALSALRRGHHVIATARSANKILDLKQAGAEILSLDVVSPLEDLKKAVAEAYALYGRIDILINAAGYILDGAVEEATPEETLNQFNVNVFGNLNVTRAVLPYMRKQRSGIIAMFGSLASWIGGPGAAAYCASKWACSAYAESLRPELASFGITVTSIEPGYFRSGFLNPGARQQTAKMDEYEASVVGDMRKVLGQYDNNQPGDVNKGAEVIVDVLTKTGIAEGKEVPLRVVLGSDAHAEIRKKCMDTLMLLDEWKEISCSTDYQK